MSDKLTLAAYNKEIKEIGHIEFLDGDTASVVLLDGIESRFLPIPFMIPYQAGTRILDSRITRLWLLDRTGSQRQQVMECLKRAGYNEWSLKNMFYLNEGFSVFDFVYAKELFTGNWDFDLWIDKKAKTINVF